jgi:NACHT domain
MSTPKTLLEFYDRLGDSWRDLADILEIPRRTVLGFRQGEEPRQIWYWLHERKQEKRLPRALIDIDRKDLAELLTELLGTNAAPEITTEVTDGASEIAAEVTDFTALIDERTEDFVGRRRFGERLWTILGDDAFRSGYLFVHGEPGIGKTALLAKLVRERNLVHHFNSALIGITSRERFLRNVCAQLILRYELPHERLPAGATSDSGFLLGLLTRAAKRERVIVAVDAVDEAVAAEDMQNRLFLPPALPLGVFFVVTMRDPDDVDLYVDEPRDLPLLEMDAENQADIRKYIAMFLDRHRRAMTRRLTELGLAEDEFTATLADRSEGNFMYLRHVLRGIRDKTIGGVDAEGIRELPRGLRAYYTQLEKQLVRRIGGDPDRELAILGVLAAWPSPLTDHRLARFAGENVTMTRAVLRRWLPFLNQVRVDGQPGYALYHASFREFLAERLDMHAVRERIGTAIESGLP